MHITPFHGFNVRLDETTLRSISDGSAIVAEEDCDWDPVKMMMKFKSYSYNHMGTLDIRAVSGSIAYLELGFDFSYNPVCHVSAKKNLIFPEHLFKTRDRRLEYPDYFDPQTSPSSKPAFEPDGWKVYGPKFDRVDDIDGGPGFWALKGDRFDGLKALYLFINSNPTSPFDKDVSSISICREEIEGSLVWVVNLDCNPLR